jgi:hypothetical protein
MSGSKSAGAFLYQKRPALQAEVLSSVSVDKRHQGDRTCAFDRDGQLSLMIGTITGNSAWHDFASFCDEVIKNGGVLIIDL